MKLRKAFAGSYEIKLNNNTYILESSIVAGLTRGEWRLTKESFIHADYWSLIMPTKKAALEYLKNLNEGVK